MRRKEKNRRWNEVQPLLNDPLSQRLSVARHPKTPFVARRAQVALERRGAPQRDGHARQPVDAQESPNFTGKRAIG